MRKKLHILGRPKLRQSMSKYNLYNLAKNYEHPVDRRSTTFWTFFKQQWYAKAACRAYHGEGIREKRWLNQFKPGMRSVVSMDPKYLAAHDGSEQALGRGSGLGGHSSGLNGKKVPKTPYMSMLFAPMERRLDMCLFRSLYASSHRQARQLVNHGFVRVNGKKCARPGYLMNPGDMFAVDPYAVMTAMGKPKAKDAEGNGAPSESQSLARSKDEVAGLGMAIERLKLEDLVERTRQDVESLKQLIELELKRLVLRRDYHANSAQQASVKSETPISDQETQQSSEPLHTTSTSLKTEDTTPPTDTHSEQRQALATVRKQLKDHHTATSFRSRHSPQSESARRESHQQETSQLTARLSSARQQLAQEQSRHSSALATHSRESRVGYALPWQPRDYMSAFAFVPRYLELNQRICAGVYLRHPVARPGLAEVPTPFPTETHQLAFNWYLGHGRKRLRSDRWNGVKG